MEYDGETAAFTASMQTLNIMLNAMYRQNARFATVIKGYLLYLGTPPQDKLGNPATKYMRAQDINRVGVLTSCAA